MLNDKYRRLQKSYVTFMREKMEKILKKVFSANLMNWMKSQNL